MRSQLFASFDYKHMTFGIRILGSICRFQKKDPSIYLYVCILSQPRKEDIRTGAQRHRAKKKERVKRRIAKVKKLKVMLQKRLKQLKTRA